MLASVETNIEDALVTIHNGIAFLLSRARRREELFNFKVRRAGVDLDWPRYLVLTALAGGQLLSVTDLALICEVEHSTMSRKVARLLKDNLIERGSEAKDRRMVLLKISEKGLEVRNNAITAREDALRKMLEGWSCDEVEGFAVALTHFRESIEEFYLQQGSEAALTESKARSLSISS